MCIAQELRTMLSQNDARTDASADMRMTGFRGLTTRPRNPPVPLATNIASESLTGKSFRRAADEFQYAVPPPAASNMYGNVINIFAAPHPLCADPHAMVYTDGSVIQSNLKELKTTVGSKCIRLETTTATIAGAGIYIPRALVTDNLILRLNDDASNAAFQSSGDEHTDGVAISLDP
jgi:hypothetical protein